MAIYVHFIPEIQFSISRFDSGSSLANHMTAEHGIVAKFTAGKEKRYEISDEEENRIAADVATSSSPLLDPNQDLKNNPFKVPKTKGKKIKVRKLT